MKTTPAPTQAISFSIKITNTPIPSHTATATFTGLPASTLRPTPEDTATPTPAHTPTTACLDTLTRPVAVHLSNGVPVSVIASFELTPYVQGRQLFLPGLQVLWIGQQLKVQQSIL